MQETALIVTVAEAEPWVADLRARCRAVELFENCLTRWLGAMHFALAGPASQCTTDRA